EAPRTKVLGKYRDGSPAITALASGKGGAIYFGFLPGLSYFAPAMPQKPMDRGASDESMTHFLPIDFHFDAALMVTLEAVRGPVWCTKIGSLVETTVIQSKQGLVIPVINWGPKAIDECELI